MKLYRILLIIVSSFCFIIIEKNRFFPLIYVREAYWFFVLIKKTYNMTNCQPDFLNIISSGDDNGIMNLRLQNISMTNV